MDKEILKEMRELKFSIRAVGWVLVIGLLALYLK